MKIVLLILTFLYLSCSNKPRRKKLDAKDTLSSVELKDSFVFTCVRPNIEKLISYYDTTYEHPNYKGHTIRSFDQKKRLIQVFKSNIFESDSKKIFAETTIYDTSGNIVYQDKIKGDFKWHCFCYKFDTNCDLIYKEGYSSGELGIRVSYFYENRKLVKEITEQFGQKIDSSY